MSVCAGKQCSKRTECKKYIGNYYGEETKQLIDWSEYGSCSVGCIAETGEQYFNQSWSCGDKSINYPLFEEHVFDKPKDLEEVKLFVFETLKRRYGNHVSFSGKAIVVNTDMEFRGNNDVWISMN